MKNNVAVAAYYFPNYHLDDRNLLTHGPGWNEWELMRQAKPRFAGHRQPRRPLWGYSDESKPEVMAQKIDAAVQYGVDAFIFDWYYYNDGTFLEKALLDGYQKAPNSNQLRYALMWANHDWVDIHPLPADGTAQLLYPGAVTEETFDRMCDYIIAIHFKHPSYWRIDGKPYFSIYEIYRLAQGFGSWPKAAAALARFRQKTIDAGFPGLHLNAVLWGVQLLPGEQLLSKPEEIISELKFDSVTSYVWVHHASLSDFPVTGFDQVFAANQSYWQQAQKSYPVPYYPNVTAGWDASPRTVQNLPYTNAGYPHMAMMESTPQKFEAALAAAIEFAIANCPPNPVVTVNAWNEWTEGSYLEPDTDYGFAYLEAIKRAKQNILVPTV